MKTKDGGPLAPIYVQAADGKVRCQERGITLRTYLVGQAIAGSALAWWSTEINDDEIGKCAVRIADAVIKEMEL